MIGLTCGLVIVDTVECKCLLVEVNEDGQLLPYCIYVSAFGNVADISCAHI